MEQALTLENLTPGNYPKDLMSALKTRDVSIHSPVTKHAILMVFDIKNFTYTFENNSPEVMIRFLNKFLDEACSIIQREDGAFVNKFTGDGLFAHFSSVHAVNAINVAFEIQRIFNIAKYQYRTIRGYQHLGLSIVVSKEEVAFCRLGKAEYTDYSIISRNVNRVFHMIDGCEGNNIITTDQTIDSLRGNFIIVRKDSQKYSGIPMGLTTYLVFPKNICGDKKCEPNTAEYSRCDSAWKKGKNGKKLSCYSCSLTKTLLCNSWNDCLAVHISKDDKPPFDSLKCCFVCMNYNKCLMNYWQGFNGQPKICEIPEENNE